MHRKQNEVYTIYHYNTQLIVLNLYPVNWHSLPAQCKKFLLQNYLQHTSTKKQAPNVFGATGITNNKEWKQEAPDLFLQCKETTNKQPYQQQNEVPNIFGQGTGINVTRNP